MPKLHFRYGAMGSGKTTMLLVALHQYKQTGKTAILIKPKVDTRNGPRTVWSRVPGLTREADIVLAQKDLLTPEQVKLCLDADCVFVDEAQFLHPQHVEQLSRISQKVPVICYGLRTDFRGQLFAGSRALFQWADSFEEVKNVCKYCSRKSSMNLRLAKPADKATVELGADELYVGVCKACFYARNPDPALISYQVHKYPEIVIDD